GHRRGRARGARPIGRRSRDEGTRRMTAAMFLAGAIVCEVVATAMLRVAALGRRALYALVVVGYVLAFALLSLSLEHGFGLGAAYAIWTAVGVAATAVVAWLAFGEKLSPTSV